jgi:hypothetical protein
VSIGTKHKNGFRCSYCGCVAEKPHTDHFIPKRLGGNDSLENLYSACRTCNSIKGGRVFDEARHMLVLKRIGWPKFTKAQIEWLRRRGLDLSEYDSCKLFFEEFGKPEFEPRRAAVPPSRKVETPPPVMVRKLVPERVRHFRCPSPALPAPPASAFFEGVRL